jgi:uncharacterized protein (UPF0332 family)
MTQSENNWEVHEKKAFVALEEAKVLFAAGLYDGASIRAAGSCIQMAKSLTLRHRKETDSEDWLQALSKMSKEGRLPDNLWKLLGEIRNIHDLDVATSVSHDEKHATDMLELARGFHRLAESASALLTSRASPEVKAAAEAKGIKLPYPPFSPRR